MLFFYAVFRVWLVLFRHLQDCHNIFFRQRLEEANVSVSAENAFLGHFLNLGVRWMNAKLSEGGWHAYGVAPGLPGGDGCEGSGVCRCSIGISAGLGNINIRKLSHQTVQIFLDLSYTHISPSFPTQLQVRLREPHQTYRQAHVQSYVWQNQIHVRHR